MISVRVTTTDSEGVVHIEDEQLETFDVDGIIGAFNRHMKAESSPEEWELMEAYMDEVIKVWREYEWDIQEKTITVGGDGLTSVFELVE